MYELLSSRSLSSSASLCVCINLNRFDCELLFRQVDPRQGGCPVREAAGRPALLQGGPHGLAQPLGTERDPPQLRSSGLQGIAPKPLPRREFCLPQGCYLFPAPSSAPRLQELKLRALLEGKEVGWLSQGMMSACRGQAGALGMFFARDVLLV